MSRFHDTVPRMQITTPNRCVALQASIAEKAGLPLEEVDERLSEVVSLLPGLLPRLPNIKANTVAQLCADTRVSSLKWGI